MVIVPDSDDGKGRFTNIIGSHGDQEHVTVVEAISAGGIPTPPLIIVKGKVILVKWFADIFDDDYLIGVSESGYANDVLFFQWLQHWEAMSRRTQKGDYRLLLMDGYDSHLTYTALKFCEMQNVVVVLLPPHTTHFLQPLDVAVFQQWKHYHAQVIDRSVRQGVGSLDKSHFLAYIEEIRTLALTPRNVKSGFRKCGYWPFRPEGVLQQLVVNGAVLEEVEQEQAGQRCVTPPQSSQSTTLQPIWDSPIAHEKLVKQADAIQNFFRPSAEPPSPNTMVRFRVNLEKFLSTVKAKDILQESLTAYIWESSIAKGKEDRRKSRRGTQVQKGGVVYAADVERDISNIEPFLRKLGGDLSIPQQIFAVRMRTMVNDQFRRNKLAKRMKEIADGKLKLRPEHPDQNATVVCKLGWTEWTTKGMGRGKAPRKKPQKRTRPETEEESNDSEGEFEGTPCPDGNNNITLNPPSIPSTQAAASRGTTNNTQRTAGSNVQSRRKKQHSNSRN